MILYSFHKMLFVFCNFAFCNMLHFFFFAFYRSGLRVETNHLPYKRKYTVWGVTKESADKRQFEIDDKDSGKKYKLTVAEYFKETYKKQLRCTFAVFV